MYKPFFLLLLVGLLFTSCVPTQDLIYLQNKENNDVLQAVNPVVFKPYRLQINDIVSITLKALDQQLVEMFNSGSNAQALTTEQSLYQLGYSVDDHGNIRIPVLGEVNVLGHTIEEARVKIENQLLEEYFNKEANIFVNIKLSGFRYTINGEVNQPGTKTLFSDRVSIMEAIANAGDITITGDRKDVMVMRQSPSGTQMQSLDLTDISSMQSPYYQLQPNDYIYVKPLPQKSWGTGTTGVQSLTTIITALTLVSTTILLLTR
ncbi:MAG TPA: polysaccharide biosynthesis/export family protein [Flavobacterium sp.]|jgi:polysaccharide export outer membrane protein|nr:polysaccharide biosynthesis/export family protein [Flavobacterium sp.]